MILTEFKILESQNPEYKILSDSNILASRNPEFQMLAGFKI